MYQQMTMKVNMMPVERKRDSGEENEDGIEMGGNPGFEEEDNTIIIDKEITRCTVFPRIDAALE